MTSSIGRSRAHPPVRLEPPQLAAASAAAALVAALCLASVAAPAGARDLSRSASPPRSASPARDVAFVNVAVIPMAGGAVLHGQTVLVQDGRIAAIGPVDRTDVPEGALVVEGEGKYLLPGLADMHVHVPPGSGEISDHAGRALVLLLASGVTTARSMIGHADHLALRERLRAGELLGPDLVLAGPPLTGESAPTPEAAAAAVRDQAAAGYDFVKLIGGFGPDVYASVVETAREAGLPVAGHVPAQVGLARAMDAGQQLEHLDGFVAAAVAEGAPVTESESQLAPGAVLEHVDDAKLAALASEVAERGLWVCPTLTLFRLIASDATPDELASRPEMRYVAPHALAVWREQRAGMLAEAPPAAERRRFVEVRDRIVRALHEAGARLLAGSDSPQLFQVAGSALHAELRSLADSGLSPHSALEAATRNAAQYLGRLGESGTVEVGKRADLILVEGDPLEDLGRLERPAGVLVRGRWLPRPELDRLLEEVAASAAAAPVPPDA